MHSKLMNGGQSGTWLSAGEQERVPEGTRLSAVPSLRGQGGASPDEIRGAAGSSGTGEKRQRVGRGGSRDYWHCWMCTPALFVVLWPTATSWSPSPLKSATTKPFAFVPVVRLATMA